MQTTLSVDDELLRRAKEEASRQGTTLSAIVEAALREKLQRAYRPKQDVPFELPVFHVPEGRGGLRPGLTWEELPYLDDDSSPW